MRGFPRGKRQVHDDGIGEPFGARKTNWLFRRRGSIARGRLALKGVRILKPLLTGMDVSLVSLWVRCAAASSGSSLDEAELERGIMKSRMVKEFAGVRRFLLAIEGFDILWSNICYDSSFPLTRKRNV